MTVSSLRRLVVCLIALSSLALGDPVVKTLPGSPVDVLAAAEQALRANPEVIDVQIDHRAMKIRFRGSSLSGMEQYAGFGGQVSVAPTSASVTCHLVCLEGASLVRLLVGGNASILPTDGRISEEIRESHSSQDGRNSEALKGLGSAMRE